MVLGGSPAGTGTGTNVDACAENRTKEVFLLQVCHWSDGGNQTK